MSDNLSTGVIFFPKMTSSLAISWPSFFIFFFQLRVWQHQTGSRHSEDKHLLSSIRDDGFSGRPCWICLKAHLEDLLDASHSQGLLGLIPSAAEVLKSSEMRWILWEKRHCCTTATSSALAKPGYLLQPLDSFRAKEGRAYILFFSWF